MKLKPKRQAPLRQLSAEAAAVMAAPGEFMTEDELARIMGLNVTQAVKKALSVKLSRIRVKNSRYYSKKQVKAWLEKNG
jgi:hypothetical protein